MGFETILQIVIQGLNMGLIYALAALGISLIWNASGLFNFAQGDLLTVGGYVMLSTFAHWALPYPLALALTVGVMGLAGYLLSRGYFFPMFSQGLHPDIIIIGTVALMVLLQNAILLLWGPHPQRFNAPLGDTPIHFGQIILMPYYVYNIVIVVVLVGLLQLFLKKTIIGIAMRAVAQRQVTAALMGVRVDQLVALTFLLATALAAIAGVLIAPIIPLIPEMGSLVSLKAFAAVLIGGLGSFAGALVGGVIVGVAEVVFATVAVPTYKDVFIFAILVAFLILRPRGIFSAEISEKV
jgi:branched-chain amino acid transport system permease protein